MRHRDEADFVETSKTLNRIHDGVYDDDEEEDDEEAWNEVGFSIVSEEEV